MKRIISSLAGIAFLSSCIAFHAGFMDDSVSLNQGNFETLKLAYGQSSATYFLGIGGLNPDGLVLEAKRNMYRHYPLKKNQVYANLSIDSKKSFLILFVTHTITISADIVQFEGETDQTNQKLFSGRHDFQDTNLESYFDTTGVVSDTLSSAIMVNGALTPLSRLISVKNGKRFDVIDVNGEIHKEISKNLLYTTKEGFPSSRFRCKVGDTVTFKFQGEMKTGKVVGISEYHVAIQSDLMTHQIADQEIVKVLYE